MAARRLVVWHQYRNDLAAVTAVDAEIRVECENSRILVQFSQAHQRGVGQRHRHVAVTGHELTQRGPLVFEAETDPEDAAFGQREQFIGVKTVAG
jgi:hypothetical protein